MMAQSASTRAPTGLVERVTYHSAENGLRMLRVDAHRHKTWSPWSCRQRPPRPVSGSSFRAHRSMAVLTVYSSAPRPRWPRRLAGR
jgi:hypothetical protein